MAGSRDTPAERREREQALAEARDEVKAIERLWVPDSAAPKREALIPEVLEVVEPDPTPSYGRRAGSGERRAFVASAARIKLDDRKAIAATRRRRQAWQSEAWDYADEIPEVGNTLEFEANLISKLRLFSAVRPDPEGSPVAVDDEESGVDQTEAKIAMETLDRLRSCEGGVSVLLGDIAYNFEVAGEAYLHGHEDPVTGEEDWNIRSVDELVVQGDTFGLRSFPGSNTITAIPTDDMVIRLWVKSRRFSGYAVSAMRRVLSPCENIQLLDREIRATSNSRLHNGFMIWPQGMSFGPADSTRDSGDGEGTDDPFLNDIETAIVTAIQEPGSAASFSPIHVQGPDNVVDKIRHIKISRDLDQVLDSRLEGQVMRVARGLSQPVEVTTGLQSTTFANAAVVRRSEWDSYGEPRATLIVDALTAGYYQWMLEEAGIARERARLHFIWYDPSDCIAAPDPVDNADKGLDEGIISEEAWRRAKGFTDADAPDDDERLQRLVMNTTRQDPFIMGQLLKRLLDPSILIPNPPAGIVGEDSVEPIQAAAVLVAAPKPSKKGERLARRLADIDRDLRTRLRTAAELALRRVLERAGNKVKNAARKNPAALTAAKDAPPRLVAASVGKNVVNALGLSDESLVDGGFEELTQDFGAWVDVAYTQAVGEIERAIGPLDQAVKQQLMHDATRSGQSATEWLGQQMNKLAAARLYDPVSTSVGGEAGVSSTVPEMIVRAAVGIAGGDDPQLGAGGSAASATGGWLGGVGTGPLVLGQVGAVEAYQWDWGSAPRNPFEAHLALNGVVVESFEDDALANDSDFPESDYLAPGDHAGCVCDWTPVLVIPDEGSTEQEE
jgi:hypothetical protein